VLTGELLYGSATDVLSRRTIGGTGDVLTVSGGLPVWAAAAAVATTVTITDDTTTNASMFLTWVTTASGNQSVNVSSTKITFNPSTATLTVTKLSAPTSVSTGTLAQTGKTTTYNNVNTAGWGAPAIYGSGRSTAQVAAVASVATYTMGAADGSVDVSANVNVTTSTTHNFAVQVAYTDETNTARTLVMTLSTEAGVLVTAITNVTGAGIYDGFSVRLRCKASTAITVKTAGTFTTVTYNVEADIQQVA
jgi:hypothetical protein